MAEFSKLLAYSAGTAGVALILGYLNIIRPLRYHGRVFVYVCLIVLCALLGTVEGVLFSMFGKRGLVQWVTARTFYSCCKAFLGIKVEIEDPHHYLSSQRPAVFICNHQSMLDILILGATFPKWCSVTAKKALKWYPFLGWFMAASKTIFVDRARRDNALKAFDSARKEILRDRQSVFMFPEGTRSFAREPILLPFKKGAFHFAQQAQIPIVPYVVSNYSNIWNWETQTSTPGTIKIRVLDPVSTEGLKTSDVASLTESTRARMVAAAEELGYAAVDP